MNSRVRNHVNLYDPVEGWTHFRTLPLDEDQQLVLVDWLADDLDRKLPAPTQPMVVALMTGAELWAMTAADAVFYDDVPELRVDQYPLLRRFYSQQPARRSRYVRELYDAIREANAARQTYRNVVRTHRAELMDMPSRESLYAIKAEPAMQAFAKQMGRIAWAPTLDEAQKIAIEYGKRPDLATFIRKLRRTKRWNDLGALKADLLEHLLGMKNRFAKDRVGEIRALERGAAAR